MAQDASLTSARVRTKRAGFSARVPESLHHRLQAIANVTGDSLSSVLEDAFLRYVTDYVGGAEFSKRADGYRDALQEVADRLQSGTPGWQPPGRRTSVARSDERTTQIAVRIPEELDRQMRNVTLALGITLNDAVVEAAEQWADYFPMRDQRFVQRVKATFASYLEALETLGFDVRVDGTLLDGLDDLQDRRL